MLLFSEMLNLQEEYSICWNENFKINYSTNMGVEVPKVLLLGYQVGACHQW